LRALASATFLMGRALICLARSRISRTCSFVTGSWGLLCFASSSLNLKGSLNYERKCNTHTHT
jgi:hypothetical protein